MHDDIDQDRFQRVLIRAFLVERALNGNMRGEIGEAIRSQAEDIFCAAYVPVLSHMGSGDKVCRLYIGGELWIDFVKWMRKMQNEKICFDRKMFSL